MSCEQPKRGKSKNVVNKCFCRKQTTDSDFDIYSTSRSPRKPRSALELELLTEEFNCYMRVGKSMLNSMKRPQDIDVSMDLLEHCERLFRNDDYEVKVRTRNFLQYCLRVIYWTSQNQPVEIYKRFYQHYLETGIRSKQTKLWLMDGKSFVAVKSLPDGCAIFYSAVSNNPECGWCENGLKPWLPHK